MPHTTPPTDDEDTRWMREALDQARLAYDRGDWPTGAVLVQGGQRLAYGQNRQASGADPLLHAETDAIHNAARALGPDAVRGATLYCTMEPCPMCAGALKQAGVGRLVVALRHARLGRTDLGRYRIEDFCEMTGYPLPLRDGVLESDYLALRLRWGGDQTGPR